MSLFDLNFASISREAAEQMADQETEQKLNEEIENVGKAVREKEHTVYARILDFSQLKKRIKQKSKNNMLSLLNVLKRIVVVVKSVSVK